MNEQTQQKILGINATLSEEISAAANREQYELAAQLEHQKKGVERVLEIIEHFGGAQ